MDVGLAGCRVDLDAVLVGDLELQRAVDFAVVELGDGAMGLWELVLNVGENA